MLKKTCVCFIALWMPLAAKACVKHDVQKILAPFDPHLISGIEVFAPSNQSVIYQHNSTNLFKPGSNTKLFTAYAALKKLGPDYQISTSLQYEDAIKHGSLQSDVLLKFNGDPTLSYEDYANFVQHLKQKGIRTIEGDFILDDSAFSGAPYSPGVTWDDFDWGFAPPTYAYSFEGNKFSFALMPSQTLNQAVSAEVEQFQSWVKVKANLKTVSESDAEDCGFEIQQNGSEYNLTGCWPIAESASRVSLANRDLPAFMPTMIAHLLAEHDIKLNGQVIFGRKSYPEQMTHLSPKLSELVFHILRYSNNFYSDSIIRTLGLEESGIGSLHEGMKVVREVLVKEAGLDDSFVLADGAGLSHYNLVSAHHISRLLDVVANEPFFEIYKAAMPQPFERGNLRERLHSVDVKDNVYAKTGTLKGHSTLCGYLENHQGQMLHFSLLLNNSQLSNKKLTQIEDQLVIALHKADVT